MHSTDIIERECSPAPINFSLQCPVFALVIGIDRYEMSSNPTQSPNTLRGCVNDSNAFHDFLISLAVPEDHIKVLQNEQATRDAILEAFETHFIRNDAIQRNDCIVLYFAGHGGRQPAPANMYPEERCVETFCPFDVVNKGGIPDYTLSFKLRQLAGKRGNNIIAILDSCHSGGMARVDGTEESVRCYDPSIPLRPLPQDLPGTQDRKDTLPGTIYDPDESFILLAACHARESALEIVYNNRTSGAFTRAFLDSISSWRYSVNGRLTYVRLMESLGLRNQRPHCEGKNRVRLLFSPSDRGCDDPKSSIVTPAENGRYYVSAGSIHGVVKGTEFVSQPFEGHSPICLIVETVEEFRSQVVPDPPLHTTILPLHSRVKVSKLKAKWLKVELIPRDGFPDELESEDALFILDNPPALRLKLMTDYQVRVERTHPLLKHIDNDSDDRLTLQSFEIEATFIDQIAHFDFFLHSQPFHALNVSVSLHLLRTGKDNIYLPVDERNRTFANLFKPIQSEGIYEAHEAIIPDKESVYGLTITNHSPTDLYPYVFFLDPYRYTIHKLYLPSSTAYPPLKRYGEQGSELSLGYGTQNATPWKFTEVPDGLPRDSGFLKVFVSRTYINMESFHTAERRAAKRIADSIAKCWASWVHVITVSRDL